MKDRYKFHIKELKEGVNVLIDSRNYVLRKFIDDMGGYSCVIYKGNINSISEDTAKKCLLETKRGDIVDYKAISIFQKYFTNAKDAVVESVISDMRGANCLIFKSK